MRHQENRNGLGEEIGDDDDWYLWFGGIVFSVKRQWIVGTEEC